MKKSILFAAVIAVAFTSCKKDRVCTCTETTVTTTTTSQPGKTPTTSSSTSTDASIVTYTKAKKGDAKKACLDTKTTEEGSLPILYQTWTSETTTDCTLK